jgi:hypothetical protein
MPAGFTSDRDDAITCSNRCRQARFRHRHRKPDDDIRAQRREIRLQIAALKQLYVQLSHS